MLIKERIEELFEYRDGNLYRKISLGNQKAGDMAGFMNKRGYWQIQFDGKKYQLHRVIFFLHNGYLPDELDHIDNDRGNNRIEKLRPATRSENLKNTSLRCDNTSGHKNVQFHKPTRKWKVSLRINGKKTHIGLYDDIDMAALAAEDARKLHNGEYANKGALNELQRRD